MDSALVSLLCFVLAAITGYFVGRITGSPNRDGKDID